MNNFITLKISRGTVMAIAGMTPFLASAQLTIVDLQPAGSTYSQAIGVRDGQQVGGSSQGACLWTGTAASWVNLTPAGINYAFARAVAGGQQVGNAEVGGAAHACMWNGTAASMIDLHPAGASQSYAMGIGDGQQVGHATIGGIAHAARWTGSAASFVDLAPAGATSSQALGVSGALQVGFARLAGVPRAGYWTGTAASWVDLHPAGAIASQANAVHNGVQVGDASFGGDRQAGMWQGTAASWINLAPPGSTGSTAVAVFGNVQVGWVMMSNQRASLWNGSAGTWVDLHALLPSNYVMSQADGVWKDGNTLYIAGSGYNTNTFTTEALMWKGTIENFAFGLNKVQVAGQNSVQGTIAIPEPSVVNMVFTTYDNSSLVTTPATVTVLAGQLYRNFQITTTAITSTIQTTIFAKRGALIRSAPLTLIPLVPTALAFTPSQVTGGNPVSCRVVINGVAGPGGRVISIFDNSPYATSPSTVTVPAGATDVTFPITTVVVTNTKFVTVTARVSAGEKTGTFRINP